MPNSTPQSQLIRAHVFVTGRVQGVGFRYSTVDTASQLGLTGWVRNLPDGRVEAVFEGVRDIVEDMVRWCHAATRRLWFKMWRLNMKSRKGCGDLK